MAIPSFNLVPGNLNINAVVGNDFTMLLDFDIDLTGYTFDAQVILQNVPANTNGVFSVNEVNLSEGRISINLTDTQTKNIGPLSNTKWYLSWSTGGNDRTVLSGKFTLNQPWAVGEYTPTSSPVTVTIDDTTVDVTVIGGAGGSILWGDIQGDIEDQTDLISYLQGNYAPYNATYITQTASSGLSNEQAIGDLSTGLLKNTTTTGVLTIAVAGTDYITPSGDGSGLTNLNAGSLASGTVPAARGGAGTINGVLKANGSGGVSAATTADFLNAGAFSFFNLTPSGSAPNIDLKIFAKGTAAVTISDDVAEDALEITSGTRKLYDFNGVTSFDFGNRQIVAPGGDTLFEVRDNMVQIYSGGFTPGTGIVGSDGVDPAPAGYVGELVEQARVNQGVSTSPSNVGILNLTAGDWDINVSGFMITSGPGTVTITKAALCISTVSATFQNPSSIFVGSSSAADEVNQPLAVMRPLRISSPTTIYIVGQLVGDGIANAFTGNIYARRVR